MASQLFTTLLALCAFVCCTLAQLPTCGTTGRQCIEDISECDGTTCNCINPPFVWGDGFFMCYRQNTVASESRNDPSFTTFNNETADFPFPCRYLLTHVKQELKGRGRRVIGKCEIKVHAFNRKNRGKITTHGFDLAVKLYYDNGTHLARSVRKYGEANDGVNNFKANWATGYYPNGDWPLPIVSTLYEDRPNKVIMQCVEEPNNNQLNIELKACGLRITFVPYDIVRRRNQPQIPGLSVGINCAHHPVWLSNDEVIGLPPVFQGGQYLSEILRPGLDESQSLVDRAFLNNAIQNQPYAQASCSDASAVLATCDDTERAAAYYNCYWILTQPRFIKCAYRNGLDFVDLFTRCVAAWCDNGTCQDIIDDMSVCSDVGRISQLDDFLAGNLCP